MATADEIQAIQIDFAQSSLTAADALISELREISELDEIIIEGVPSPDYANSDIAADPISTRDYLLQFRPLTPPLFLPGASRPVAPAVNVAIPTDVVVPTFDLSAPVLEIPVVPSTALPTAPSAPSVTDPVLPTAPNITLPSAPVVGAISLPDPPSITIPTFSASVPVDDLIVPSDSFVWAEAAYTSANLEELEEKLLNELRNGGYGIENADEAALWQRGRDRENVLLAAETNRILTESAARGFPLPPGSQTVLIQRAHEDHAAKLASLSREIMIKRGDLYVENRKFTIQEARQLESILINYYAGQMERALNAQKATLDFAIQLFNALVGRYNARIAGYQAQAAVFAKQLEASLIQVQVYKTLIEGKAIEANIQRTLIESYRATLAGIETTVNIYRTQMQAAQVQADVERLKIEGFKARVDAYGEQVRAKVSEFGLYEAQIRGQVARVQAYEGEVRAYTAAVGGAEAQARIKATQVEAAVKKASIQLDAYRADIQRYQTDLNTQVQSSASVINYFNAQTSLYKADVDALVESYRLAQTTFANDRSFQLKNADIAISNARLAFDTISKLYDIKLGASKAGSEYYGRLVAGAQSAITSVASKAE